ncbi:hypothetical protein B0H14DRAFT_562802 [Mycena olivaceomarginata]|nr:hypothetical protein B0H14DRAFT_562802 [Mycena olivaceomarginata]
MDGSWKLLATVVEARRGGSENIPKKLAHPRRFGIIYNGGWPLRTGSLVHEYVVDTRRARSGSVLLHLAHEKRRPCLLELAVPIRIFGRKAGLLAVAVAVPLLGCGWRRVGFLLAGRKTRIINMRIARDRRDAIEDIQKLFRVLGPTYAARNCGERLPCLRAQQRPQQHRPVRVREVHTGRKLKRVVPCMNDSRVEVQPVLGG